MMKEMQRSNFEQFKEYIRNNIKKYLPEEYRDASVYFETVRQGLNEYTGIKLQFPGSVQAPYIAIDQFYQDYMKYGNSTMSEVMYSLADAYARVAAQYSSGERVRGMQETKNADSYNDGYRVDIRSDMKLLQGAPDGQIAAGDVSIGCFVFHNVRVVEAGERADGSKGLSVRLPVRQNPKTMEWEEVIHVPEQVMRQVEKVVIQDVKDRIRAGSSMMPHMDINVNLCRSEYWPTLAYVNITMGNTFEVRKIRVIDDEHGNLCVRYPGAKDKAGQFETIFSGASSEYDRQIERAVLNTFQEKYKARIGQEYTPVAVSPGESRSYRGHAGNLGYQESHNYEGRQGYGSHQNSQGYARYQEYQRNEDHAGYHRGGQKYQDNQGYTNRQKYSGYRNYAEYQGYAGRQNASGYAGRSNYQGRQSYQEQQSYAGNNNLGENRKNNQRR